jgi:hypothetical protein
MTSKSVTFCKEYLMITRVDEGVIVNRYDYPKISDASKSRLENLQFTTKNVPMVLFTTDNKEVFTVLDWVD